MWVTFAHMQCMYNIFGSIAKTVVGHKKSGKNLQILRPIFWSFWSRWLACFGWMASQNQMCLTGICQGTILDIRQKFHASAHFWKSQILDTDPSKLKLLTATLHWCVPDPFYWEHIWTFYCWLFILHSKSLHTLHTMYQGVELCVRIQFIIFVFWWPWL